MENKTENIWMEITKDKRKYIIVGIYRHPNQNVKSFQHYMDEVMADIATRRITRITASDMNIDLTKCETNCDTAKYIDMLLTNNFMSLLEMPTRITATSGTLIDHIYCFDYYF